MRNLEHFPSSEGPQELIMENRKTEGDERPELENPKEKTPEDVVQRFDLQQERLTREEKEKGHSRFSKVKSAISVGILSLAILAGGCSKSEGQKKTEAKESQKTAQVEKQDDQETKESKYLLKEMFSRISAGGIDKAEDGDLLLHTGGGSYYELNNDNLNELMQISSQLSKHIRSQEGKTPEVRNRIILQLKNAGEVQMRDAVSKIGKEVDKNNLTPKLKEWEGNRQKSTEDMQKAKTIQDIPDQEGGNK